MDNHMVNGGYHFMATIGDSWWSMEFPSGNPSWRRSSKAPHFVGWSLRGQVPAMNGAPVNDSVAKLVNITWWINYGLWWIERTSEWVYKPTNITMGPHIVGIFETLWPSRSQSWKIWGTLVMIDSWIWDKTLRIREAYGVFHKCG